MQALKTIDGIGDDLMIKYSTLPVPGFSENDSDFQSRWVNESL